MDHKLPARVYNPQMKLFACPLCFDPLIRVGGSLKCSQNHSYDLAREGYVNLLTAQHRRSKAPGDNAQMIAARGRFLDAGYYQPLADGLAAAIAAEDRIRLLADLGCGEGYFPALLSPQLEQVYGIDISRPAIRAAARRSETLSLAVASTVRLPLANSGFDAVTVVMAPMSADIVRILKPRGRLYRVTPGPDHLTQLKRQVYARSRAHERADTRIEQFRLVSSRHLTFEFTVDGSLLGDLIAMTPLAYTSAGHQRNRALEIDQLAMTADFWLDEFELIVR